MNPNLEMQVNQTKAGLLTVTYGRKEAPLDVQEAAFAANGLDLVSPAQLGFLRPQNNSPFLIYSRTNGDVFYDSRNNQVVIVPDGAISRLVGTANLVEAHRNGIEYTIPISHRDVVYAMVDEMLRKGTAFKAAHGQTDINLSEFGNTELTSKLFSDEMLGAKSQDYGDFMKDKGRTVQRFFFDDKDYAKSQKAPYLNRLRVYGPGGDFDVSGDYRYLHNYVGAFGVRLKAAEGGKPQK